MSESLQIGSKDPKDDEIQMWAYFSKGKYSFKEKNEVVFSQKYGHRLKNCEG